MASSQYPSKDTYQHKRVKSSVLTSFLSKRTPSAGEVLSPISPTNVFVASPSYDNTPDMPFPPQEHPQHRALGELHHNQQNQPPTSPRKEGWHPYTSDDGSSKSLHKKTLSSISLKSLAGRDTDKQTKAKGAKVDKPKKTKSSTNLANLLSRPKSSKNLRKQAEEEEARKAKDKENRSPILPSETSRPPIYAQFSSDCFAKQPLGGKFLEDEIDLYTPQQYYPGKQRDFYNGPDSQPSLTKRDDGPQRPKSTYLPHSFSIQDITRRVSGGSSRHSAEILRKASGDKRPSFDRKTTDKAATLDKAPNRGQRVLAALPGFGDAKQKPTAREGEQILDDRDVDREFEAMLDRRNIPEHQRGKMRSLAISMKKDFVKQDWAEIATSKNSRPGTNGSNSSADVTTGEQDIVQTKSKRPRSRTFTLSRKSSKETVSVSKKTKPEGTIGKHSRTKSSESMSGGKSLTSSSASVAQTLIAKAKGQCPDDFVSYLRKVQKPELVEVGRLHKLRLLLRNETVAWTDEFIGHGGMDEIVGLLNRTMEVEWRFVLLPNFLN